MSTTTKSGVLAVMGRDSHALRNAGLPYGPLVEACATVERLAAALEQIKVLAPPGTMMRVDAEAALADFRGDA